MAELDIGDLDAKFGGMGLAGIERVRPECLEKEGAINLEPQPALTAAEDGVPVALVKSGAQLTKQVEEAHLTEEVDEVHNLNTETKDDNSGVTKCPTLPKRRRYRRVGSHQKNIKDSSAVKLDLVQLQEELRQTKNKLQEASARNDELSKEFERYKIEYNCTKQWAVERKATALKKELEAYRKESGELTVQNKFFERCDSEEQQRLDGRHLSYPQENISFYKRENPDESTEVSLIRSWNFPVKTWWKNRILRQKADNAANQNQDGMGFIDREYWANEALSLAELLGHPFSDGEYYEKHVEPQLVALYITRMLEASEHTLNDFYDLSCYQNAQLT
ncbi:hypothetical protein PTNB73_06373 [Pyrenophora teres f. teres]|nr:hypothetical protein PTNB85_07099 [Pyrenophora teres f. teres]KAE8863166.1 hypothetical protein PTNB73_06373 [Pyrenophora teres f. teres]